MKVDAAARRAARRVLLMIEGPCAAECEANVAGVAEITTVEYAPAMEALEERIQAACAYECSAAPGQREHTPGCVKARAALDKARGEEGR